MARKYRRSQIEVCTYVDVNDLIADIDDQDLLDEIALRKLSGAQGTYCPLSVPPEGDAPATYRAWAEELRDAAKSGDWMHFEVLLLRMAPISARESAGKATVP